MTENQISEESDSFLNRVRKEDAIRNSGSILSHIASNTNSYIKSSIASVN